MIRAAVQHLRAVGMTWAVAGMLPLPVLVATDPDGSADVACLYLGLFCAWLATEIIRCSGPIESRCASRSKTLAIFIAVTVNVAVFILFGLAAGVQTHFPFPLMAVLPGVPAIGLVPWLMRRMQQPYAAIICGGVLVFMAKLAGCVVARFVYGPDYIALGYVAADWRSARLMISLFWLFTTVLSLALLLADWVGPLKQPPHPAMA